MRILLVLITLGVTSIISSCSLLLPTLGIAAVSSSNDRRTIGAITDDEVLDFSLENWGYNDKKFANSHLNFNVYNKNVLVTGELSDKATEEYLKKQIRIREPLIVNVLYGTTIAARSSLLSRARDGWIDRKILLSFANQEVFNPVHVKVHTENGIVYLMGDVTKREADKATSIISNIQGITKVVKFFNYLSQVPQQEINDAKQRIKEAEERRIKEKKLKLLRDQQQELNMQIQQLEY